MLLRLAGGLVGSTGTNIVTATIRDLRNFLESKRIKREPLQFRMAGVGSASCRPRTHRGLDDLRRRLRGSVEWGRQSELFDKLESALRRRHAIGLPVPEEVTQRDDGGLSMHWDGLTVMAYPGKIGALLGGTAGGFEPGIKPALLDALRIRHGVAMLRN